ncbi:MAG TPA: AMP-binding protein [Longimicrobiales bacterium]|nr:AMP-binding protein [Longimicrobiales bacterium]
MTARAPDRGNVAQMLWAAAARHPHRDAVIERERTATYAELVARAAAIADALRSAGVARGDRVVILQERGIDAVASYFGVLAAGAMTVVLNPLLRPRQVEYALEQSGAKVLLTSAAVRARVHRDVRTPAAVLDVDDVPASASFEPVTLQASEPAQITYTSGSTGMPKGVVASHANVWSVIETVAGYLGIREDDRIAGMLPISGVYGANQMQCAVFAGATLIVPTSPVMNDVAGELRDAGVTVLAAVPPLWMQLLQAPRFTAEPIPTLRIVQNAGGHLAPAGVQRIREAQPQAQVFLQYGMTEVFRSTYLPPDEIDRRPGCMGRPMDGAEIMVVGEDGRLCEAGETGELVHSGPTVTMGYWNDPERTAEVFRPHPVNGVERVAVYSGDMVRRDEDGYLWFVGRKDRMIKTLGYRVGPDEILDVLYASKQISEGLVTAEEDSDRGQRVVACVVLAPHGSLKELRMFCRAELPRYMQPAEIIALAALPKLPNGKHDLLTLREQIAASRT